MRVGIDLGTTFSAVARMRGGQPEIILNREGARLTPSVVLIQEDGTITVGEVAKEQAVLHANGVVAAVKNSMGKTNKVFHLADGKEYSPETISSFILRRLVEDAQRVTGEPVEGAVVTIPATFNDAQRKATEDAVSLAGLNLIATVNEPTAAAICYASRLKAEAPQNIMVYDLGGGTFDVTVIRVQGSDVKVLSTYGLSGVGGKFFDQAIIDYVCRQFLDKHGIDLEDEEYLDEYQELVLKAEICKIQLSSKDNAVIPLRIGKVKEGITVTRDFLEQEVMKFYWNTEASVKKTVRDAGLTFEALDKVVLVGGSSKIPVIQTQLEKLTGRAPSMDMNPDEAVALGAAIFTEIHGETASKAAMKVSDICSHSVGIVVLDEEYEQVNHILLHRNTAIPCSVEESLYTTISDQPSIHVTITEGEFAELADVTVLAEETIDLPSGLADHTEVTVVLNMDANQLIHLRVRIPSAGIDREYTIRRLQNMDRKRLEELKGLTLGRELQ